MAKYKVKALTISGAGKKVFRAGNVVEDKDLVPGAGAKYVESGHLELLKSSKVAPVKEVKSEAKAEAKTETKGATKKENILKKVGKKK